MEIALKVRTIPDSPGDAEEALVEGFYEYPKLYAELSSEIGRVCRKVPGWTDVVVVLAGIRLERTGEVKEITTALADGGVPQLLPGT